jgi:hypothetical protein
MSKEWWCPTCKVSPTWENVTFEERHAVCGTLVSGIDEPCPSCASLRAEVERLEAEKKAILKSVRRRAGMEE